MSDDAAPNDFTRDLVGGASRCGDSRPGLGFTATSTNASGSRGLKSQRPQRCGDEAGNSRELDTREEGRTRCEGVPYVTPKCGRRGVGNAAGEILLFNDR